MRRNGRRGMGFMEQSEVGSRRVSSLGCLGLMAFAFILWIGLPRYSAVRILMGATVVWLGVSTLLWTIHRIGSFISKRLKQIIRAIRFDDFADLRFER